MALVVAGARYTKAGKAHPATAKSSLVYAAAATEEARILITHKRPRALDTCAVLFFFFFLFVFFVLSVVYLLGLHVIHCFICA